MGHPARRGQSFASSGAEIERYAGVMNAVRINSSFHRSHRRATYQQWADSTPCFQIGVKLPTTKTPGARLIETDAMLAGFAEQVGGLGGNFAVKLVQF